MPPLPPSSQAEQNADTNEILDGHLRQRANFREHMADCRSVGVELLLGEAG